MIWHSIRQQVDENELDIAKSGLSINLGSQAMQALLYKRTDDMLDTSQLVYHHKKSVQNEAGLETAAVAAASSSAADCLISYVMLIAAEVSQEECFVSVRKKRVQLRC
jgi:hypothetical protein